MSFLQLDPNTLVLVGIVGVLLIYVELNRPGLILPGAVGLSIVLLCCAAISHLHWEASGGALLLSAVVLQLISLRRQMHWSVEQLSGLAAFFGCRHLLRSAGGEWQINYFVAACAGVVLGPGTSLLTALARRARRNKGLDS